VAGSKSRAVAAVWGALTVIKHRVFVAVILFELAVAGCLAASSAHPSNDDRRRLDENRQLVRALSLTDLALWGEARYTRHPSQADLFTPFQDYPSSVEHFPAGSIAAPPEGVFLNLF
jgi:hypothetical protein